MKELGPNEGTNQSTAEEVAALTSSQGIHDLIHRIVQAAAPIVEDGGAEEQLEAFADVFVDACFVAEFLTQQPSDGQQPPAPAQLRKLLTERLEKERSQQGEMHTWRASAFRDALADLAALTYQHAQISLEDRRELVRIADIIGGVHRPCADPELHEDDARLLRRLALTQGERERVADGQKGGVEEGAPLSAAVYALEAHIHHLAAEHPCPNYGEATESCDCLLCRTQTVLTEWEDDPRFTGVGRRA